MVMPVTTPEAIDARRRKVRRKVANIKNQQTLNQVLASFPEALRPEIYAEIAPLLKFDSKPL